MASHVVVMDSAAKRIQVKVTPGKYMTDVLEEACKKCNRQPTNLGFKNNGKQIDLSQTFRQTGLPSGARLELVTISRSPVPISVALQLPESLAAEAPNGRLIDRFPSDTTLWLVLRKFESTEGKNWNFTARGVAQTENGSSGAGRIYYEMPVVSLAGREISTLPDLAKTLSQFGVNNGSVLLRLSFRKTDQAFEEAIVDIAKYLNSLDSPAEPTATSASNPVQPQIEPVTNAVANIERHPDTSPESPPKPVSPTKRSAPDDEVPRANPLGISFFAPAPASVPTAASLPDNDSDYELSIVQMKRHQEYLKTKSMNKKLPGYDEIEKLEEAKTKKLASVKEVHIRIRFPGDKMIEKVYQANDTGLTVYEITSSVMSASQAPFKLVTRGLDGQPVTIPKDGTKLLIKDLGLTGRVLVNFLWEDDVSSEIRNAPILKEEYNRQVKELPVPTFQNAPDAPEVRTDDKGKGKQTEEGGGGKKSRNMANILGRLSKK
ncbi:ubx domain-containing protein [Phlyctema vagabunda]|uniref:Ubx domain-containing protein n=1 Tax=Phlyctema vagabunda TaxID=108571 RepID=A0ABR4P3G8_9HELO